jgi:central kinetochore subunit Mis15/CHL4
LLSLASEWCQEENLATCGPYISTGEEADDDPEASYTAAQSLNEVQELYEGSLTSRKGTKREVLDHILAGDWRHGISLLQLAMAETRSILDHPTALRWAAMRLAKPGTSASQSQSPNIHLPHFHPQTFLLNLHRELSPITKPHYYIHRPQAYPLTLIRLSLHQTPYTTARPLAATSAKSLFLAFPHATPFLYLSSGPDSTTLHDILLEAIPRALSQPDDRWELRSTALVARSLDALIGMRGSGRRSGCQGGWSVYGEGEGVETGPAEYGMVVGEKKLCQEEEEEDVVGQGKENVPPGVGVKEGFRHTDPGRGLSLGRRKRLRRVAEGRFGVSAREEDGMGLQRFDVKIEDPFPGSEDGKADIDDSNATMDEGANGKPWKPSVKLSFQGSHVFAGIRKLVESGIIDGKKLPGWMTGEAGVSNGIVKNGRLDSKHVGV